MQSIIVPINFSTCATNAANYAADLALAIKADLTLIHVIEVPVTSAEMMMTEDLYQEMVDAANVSLEQLKVNLTGRTHQKIKVDTILDAGSVAARLRDLCQQRKPYAIVLGATGPTLEKFLAGSPVASLLHNLAYPVLVVPETASFQGFRRILLACDQVDIYSGLTNSLPLLKDLRDHFGSRFDAVTVETSKGASNENTPVQSNAWKKRLKDLYPDIHYIHKPQVEDGILEYLNHQGTDLIMVFPKKHRLFDFHVSQSRKLALHSTVPILSIHA